MQSAVKIFFNPASEIKIFQACRILYFFNDAILLVAINISFL